MLETLVSSRIRCALLERILSHPAERFYLRGLAKDLHLSISPLRRELKRLERADVLRTAQEGNILFYTINTHAPIFLQLQRVSADRQPAPAPQVSVVSPAPSPVAAPTVQAATSLPRWRAPRRAMVILGTVGLGMMLVVVAGLAYVRMARERAASGVQVHGSQAHVVPAEAASSSGVLKGSRWRIQTGAVGGGFSAGGAQ